PGTPSGGGETTLSNWRAFRFDGENDYIRLGDVGGTGDIASEEHLQHGGPPRSEFSLSLWFKMPAFPEGSFEQALYGAGEHGVYVARENAGGPVVLKARLHFPDPADAAATIERSPIGTTPLVEEQWYHAVLAFMGTDINGIDLYLNGEREDELGQPGWSLSPSATAPTLGQQGDGTKHFAGFIDEVSVWEARLNITPSVAETTALFNDGSPADLTNGLPVWDHPNHDNAPIAWWRMGDDPLDTSTANTGYIYDQIGETHAVPKETAGDNIVGSGILCSTHPGGSQLAATPELCDGEDNDCDGTPDEDYPVGDTCDGVDPDLCALGFLVCDPADSSGVICNEDPASQNQVEVCDGGDNDCDGLTDAEDPVDLLANAPESCPNQAGVCAGSTRPASDCVD
ncbi:MAG: LamG domain-containing protein, partial [Myxococcota bacterium]|nr:LamG domain-containing protein [Myxococcota bacterium]